MHGRQPSGQTESGAYEVIRGIHDETEGKLPEQVVGKLNNDNVPLAPSRTTIEDLDGKRSHKIITSSMLVYLFFMIAWLFIWIGSTNSIIEETKYNTSDDSSIDSDYKEYTYLFLASNLIFTVVLIVQLYDWHANIDLTKFLTMTYFGWFAVGLAIIGSILHIIAAASVVKYQFDDTSSDDEEYIYETFFKMLDWGVYWVSSLWILYFSAFYWVGRTQLSRLIMACMISIVQCVLLVCFFAYESSVDDSTDDSSTGFFKHLAVENGLTAFGLGGIIGFSAIMAVTIMSILNKGDGDRYGRVNNYDNKYWMFKLMAILLIMSLIVYLVSLGCVFDGYAQSDFVISLVLNVSFGPIVIAYDILAP